MLDGLRKRKERTYDCALGLRPLRIYSAGTLASSGALLIIASLETSAKSGRERVRGS